MMCCAAERGGYMATCQWAAGRIYKLNLDVDENVIGDIAWDM